MSGRRAFLAIVVGLILIGAVAWGLSRRSRGPLAELAADAAAHAPVVVIGDARLALAVAAETRRVDGGPLDAALDGTDEEALLRAMEEAGARSLVVARDANGGPPAEAGSASLRARLSRYDALERLACLHLTPEAALYVPRTELVLPPLLSGALAHVARALVAGAPVPRVQSFPEPLRRIRNVEVMVLLADGERPRLWRSARGSSVARALLTAAVVARQRWMEREAAMGGPLSRVLPTLDVSVHVLEEDGTLGSRTPAFVESVFGPEHGVAYEHRGNWRYLLPDATRERGGGSAMRAYQALLTDADMPPESLDRPDLRLYRSVARRLAISPAPTGAGVTVTPHAPDGSLDWLGGAGSL